ncbi:MAG: hypothetical protein WDZ94_01940 [Patescibacteria group bacterium]
MSTTLEVNTVENQEPSVTESEFTKKLVSLLLKQIDQDIQTGKIHSILDRERKEA